MSGIWVTGGAIAVASVGKDITVLSQVQRHQRRQTGKTLLCQFPAFLALQHPDQLGAEVDQVAHVVGSIAQLLNAEIFGIAPVRALLGFIQLDTRQFLHQGLEAVAAGIGAGELAGDLSAKIGCVSIPRAERNCARSKRAK